MEERTENSIYVLFIPKKKKKKKLYQNDSHLRPHLVFPQDIPYMRELHWNQVWGRKKERAPFCNQGQSVQTPSAGSSTVLGIPFSHLTSSPTSNGQMVRPSSEVSLCGDEPHSRALCFPFPATRPTPSSPTLPQPGFTLLLSSSTNYKEASETPELRERRMEYFRGRGFQVTPCPLLSRLISSSNFHPHQPTTSP